MTEHQRADLIKEFKRGPLTIEVNGELRKVVNIHPSAPEDILNVKLTVK